MGRGRGQDFQAGTSGTQGRFYAVVPQTKLANQSDMRGYVSVLTRVLFKSRCIIFMLIGT